MRHVIDILKRYRLSVLLYGVVGIFSALTEWATFYVASWYIDISLSTLLAFAVATVVNYLLSRRTVFLSKRNSTAEFILVFAVSGVAFIGNFAVFQILRLALGWHPMVSKICGTGVGFVLNYIMRQFYVFSAVPRFREEKPRDGDVAGSDRATSGLRPFESGKLR